MNARVEVLVVGAGPIGLALACHLRRLGLSVRLIEKRSGPSVHSKAIGLQYRVSEILARLGIVERFIAQGGSPSTVNLYASGKLLLQLRFVAPAGVNGRDAFQPIAILLPQSQTEIILLEHLQELGGTLEWNTELVSYRQSADGVVAQVQHLGSVKEIAADWLVSCEGAHSVVRKQAAIAFAGKTHPLAFFMADVRMTGTLRHAENHVWLHEDGSLAALPLPTPGTWRLFIEVTRQREQLHSTCGWRGGTTRGRGSPAGRGRLGARDCRRVADDTRTNESHRRHATNPPRSPRSEQARCALGTSHH